MSIDRMRVEAVGLLQDLGWMWSGSVWEKNGVNQVDVPVADHGPVVSLTEAVQAVARRPYVTQRDVYLGDGVHATFNGCDLALITDREDGEHVIYLDSMTLNTLFAIASGTVDQIKQKSAELIDMCQEIRALAPIRDPELDRLVGLAQDAYELAAMWAVKAATK